MRTAVMGKQLLHERKAGLNIVDQSAMVVKKDSCVAIGLYSSENCGTQ